MRSEYADVFYAQKHKNTKNTKFQKSFPRPDKNDIIFIGDIMQANRPLRWVKNILILALSVLCVYQTQRLWFDGPVNISITSILGLPGARSGVIYQAALAGLSRPKRVLVSEGGNVFLSRSHGLDAAEPYLAARKAIEEVLLSGEHAASFTGAEIGWAGYLGGRSVVFDYGYSLPATAFTASFGGSQTIISGQIEAFDMIIFTADDEDTGRVVFADSLSNPPRAVEFIIRETPLIFRADGFVRSLHFSFSILSGTLFANPVFMPQSPMGGYIYNLPRPRGPLDNSITNTQNVSRLLEPFFDNFDAVRHEYSEGEFIFADAHTIARYMDGYYIEYQSWRSADKTIDSFEAAYAEAVSFMRKDISLTNEIYLSRYEYDGSSYQFYFDYIFRDLPIHMDDRLRALPHMGMDACIEITVTRNSRIRYKRYAMAFTDGRRLPLANISYQTAFSDLERQNAEDVPEVLSLDLVYQVDMLGEVRLAYRMEVDERFNYTTFPVRD